MGNDKPVSLEEMLAYMLNLWLGNGIHDPEVCRKLEAGLAAHGTENEAEIAWLVRRGGQQARGKHASPRLSWTGETCHSPLLEPSPNA